MGLRGPQPQLKLRSEPLTDLNPPAWLGHIGADYWNQHAHQLAENQLLTASTAQSFGVLCDLWEKWTELQGQPFTKQYESVTKAYLAWAKLFRLVPNEKPAVKEDRYADFGEVEIE